MSGVMRGERRHYTYWESFYASKASAVPTTPSAFARWVAEREPDRGGLVDIGSGTGRDSLWLSRRGFKVLGCDYAPAGVQFARNRAIESGVPADFIRFNLYDLRDILSFGAIMARDRKPDIVYARFVVHAIEDGGRRNLWNVSRSILRGRLGRLYLEFRTQATEHEFGEHYRQFVQPDVVCDELRGYGFEIDHCEQAHGLAVHHNEDPLVCRIVARMR
jgi:SAM-dependent methyltransferase